MEKPLISVITVCYNSEKTIENTLNSVINQTYKNIEYIVIDGMSKDKTIDKLKEYEKKFDNTPINYSWISEKDSGIYQAINKGIKRANGDLIGILNSDDWYENNTVEIVVNEYLKNRDKDVFYGIIRYIKNGKELKLIRHNHEFLFDGMVPHPTCFVAKKVYDSFGGYDTDYKYSSDYDYFLSLYKNKVKFKEINKILTNFRIGGASSEYMAKKETLEILYKHNFLRRGEFYFKNILLIIRKLLNRYR